jgi:hypothetical protein
MVGGQTKNFMAKLTLTSGLNAIRGQIGGFVYRVVRGKQVISAAPRPSRKPRTPPQQAQSRRLATASRQAKIALKNPQQRAAYRKRARKLGKPIMAVATSDFM